MDDRAHCSTGGGVGGGATGPEFTAGPNDAAGCTANRNRCKNSTAARRRTRLLSRRPTALLTGKYSLAPGENEFHKVSHGHFLCACEEALSCFLGLGLAQFSP